MERIISDLKNDLIADGWTVTDANAPRTRTIMTEPASRPAMSMGPMATNSID
jgi:hypothetical protein